MSYFTVPSQHDLFETTSSPASLQIQMRPSEVSNFLSSGSSFQTNGKSRSVDLLAVVFKCISYLCLFLAFVLEFVSQSSSIIHLQTLCVRPVKTCPGSFALHSLGWPGWQRHHKTYRFTVLLWLIAKLGLFGLLGKICAHTNSWCKFMSVCSTQFLSGGSVTFMTWLFFEPYMLLLVDSQRQYFIPLSVCSVLVLLDKIILWVLHSHWPCEKNQKIHPPTEHNEFRLKISLTANCHFSKTQRIETDADVNSRRIKHLHKILECLF